MANPTGKGGRRFQPGQSGNPSGKNGASVDPAIKAFKETTYKDFINKLQKYGAFTRQEIANELQRPDATMFEIMFGQIVASAAKGDKDARAVLLDRLWGKVKEVHEVHNYEKELAEIPKERIIEFLREKDEG